MVPAPRLFKFLESGDPRSTIAAVVLGESTYAVAVIGGGIVGLAAARALRRRHSVPLVVLEAEDHLAAHQTGHNSGVIHSGLYYRPGSLKARYCVAGRDEMYRFCSDHGIPHERCGKVVVATSVDEIEPLRELERRGRANGLAGMEWLDTAGLRRHEPRVAGLSGLWVPQTGIVDYTRVAEALASELRQSGAEVRTGARVTRIQRAAGGFVLRIGGGETRARFLLNCAGLQSDRIARMCGLAPQLRIVPFRGEYHKLVPERESLVRNLIYPVPDPRLPFLGVHFTRMIRGGVEVGPNAVLALCREGYQRSSFSARDLLAMLAYPGFWRLARRHWHSGAAEVRRSLSTSALVRDLRKLVPEIGPQDLRPHGAGVRAQAVAADGTLVDDFHILEAEGMLHVLSAPSPAATAALAIGSSLAERAGPILG